MIYLKRTTLLIRVYRNNKSYLIPLLIYFILNNIIKLNKSICQEILDKY